MNNNFLTVDFNTFVVRLSISIEKTFKWYYNMTLFGKVPDFLLWTQPQKSAISKIWRMCRSYWCPPKFFCFTRTQLTSSYWLGLKTMIFYGTLCQSQGHYEIFHFTTSWVRSWFNCNTKFTLWKTSRRKWEVEVSFIRKRQV